MYVSHFVKNHRFYQAKGRLIIYFIYCKIKKMACLVTKINSIIENSSVKSERQ